MKFVAQIAPVLAVCLAALVVAACSEPADAALFHRLTAMAESGSAPAQYNLGMLYNNGIGTAQDHRRAFEWFEKSAAAGDPLASYKVGCYYAGQFTGVVLVDQDKGLAAKLVAARAGYFRAQHDVANAYGSQGNFEEAIKWWTAAGAQGDLASLASLTDLYRQGLGVQRDLEKTLTLALIVTRQVPAAQQDAARPAIEALKIEVGPAAAARAENTASSWAPAPTELTMRASLGIQEARQLVR